MTSSLAILFSLVVSAPATAAWNLAPCGHERMDAWAQHERVLRDATPGSLHYVPKPFPRNSGEVIEDYVYELRQLWPTRDEVPDDMREIYDGVESNSVRFEVVPVENWTPLRCARQTEWTLFYLIRLIKIADGVELGRTTLTDDGFLAVQMPAAAEKTSTSSDEKSSELLGLEKALARIRSEYGIVGREPQYVAVAGVPLRCEAITPCVAFRAGADTYLISPRLEVVVLPSGARRLDKEMSQRPDKMAVVAALHLNSDEAVVSLGGEAFAVARLVGRLRKH
jgi:hypothetical protein